MNLPNKLTISRVVMIPFFVFFLLADSGNHPDGIQKYIASLTDWFDGNLARKNNLVTNFGKFMDPLADKLLVCSALVCFTAKNQLAAWIVIVIISREFIISGFRLLASDNGVVIAASYWGKFKTAFQMIMIIIIILDFSNKYIQLITTAVTYIAVALTIISLIDYWVKSKNIISA